MSCVLAALSAAPLAGCYKLERRSTATNGVPASLLGQWVGDWTSAVGPGTGNVTLTVQSFEGQPVLQVDAQHPCLTEATYQFVHEGNLWQLLSGGVPVFEARIDLEARTLDGVYTCSADQGEWTASWDHPLPTIADLSGTWTGTVGGIGSTVTAEFRLELEQRYLNGRLGLSGVLHVDGLGLVVPLPDGAVTWNRSGFEMFLQSGGASPAVVMQGRCGPEELVVQNGLIVVDDPRVPFRIALWDGRLQAGS